ncbi:MAG: ribosome maturation factor RimM [Candidatus Latescibacter sp.]|nr:ribosome maturation factor RimM [Candidatus Latescibacter sp.]
MRLWQVKVSRTLSNFVGGNGEKSVSIGRAIKSRGLGGELWIEPLTDVPARFEKLESVIMEKPDGALLLFEVEEARIQGNGVILKLRGVDDRTSADSLRGAYVTVGMENIRNPDEDSYYIFELEGMEVYDSQNIRIGTVSRVDKYPANAVLVIASDSEEILLPAVKEFIVSVDTVNRRLTVQLPEGLPTYPVKGKS